MSPRRNWDSPNPSLASDCALPPEGGGGHTCLRVRGWESPDSDEGTLPILWFRSTDGYCTIKLFQIQLRIFCKLIKELTIPVCNMQGCESAMI